MVVPGMLAGRVVKTIDDLARQGVEVLFLPLPQEKAADVVVQEDGSHQILDIPRQPHKFALEVGNHKATLLQAANQGIQTHMIRFLCVSHSSHPPSVRTVRSWSSAVRT
jgi:hypothetical protein